jgi:hypothetical protein
MSAHTFRLLRHRDLSGVSGTGIVAEGVEFSDGAVAIRWLGEHPSTVAWNDIRHMEAIHGHGGDTEIVFDERPSRGGSTVERIVNGLQRTDLTSCSVSFDAGRAQIHAYMAADWLRWLDHLGGSPDAAIKRQRPGNPGKFPWEWSWTAPDNSVRVFYITDNPDEITLENG